MRVCGPTEVRRGGSVDVLLKVLSDLLGYPRTSITSDIYGANYRHPVIYFTVVVRIVPEDLAAD